MTASRLFASLFALLGACSALAAPSVDRSGLLTDDRGMTLYVYKRDTLGISRCNDRCLRPWPPYVAPATAKSGGDFSIIRRDDGRVQWAYKGQPLYRFAGDAGPGDANGEHAGAVWSTVRSKAVEQQVIGSASDYAF